FSSLDYSSVAGFGVDANYIYLYYSRFENEPIPGWHYKFYTGKFRKAIMRLFRLNGNLITQLSLFKRRKQQIIKSILHGVIMELLANRMMDIQGMDMKAFL